VVPQWTAGGDGQREPLFTSHAAAQRPVVLPTNHSQQEQQNGCRCLPLQRNQSADGSQRHQQQRHATDRRLVYLHLPNAVKFFLEISHCSLLIVYRFFLVMSSSAWLYLKQQVAKEKTKKPKHAKRTHTRTFDACDYTVVLNKSGLYRDMKETKKA